VPAERATGCTDAAAADGCSERANAAAADPSLEPAHAVATDINDGRPDRRGPSNLDPDGRPEAADYAAATADT
jgi:hypothetical protein